MEDGRSLETKLCVTKPVNVLLKPHACTPYRLGKRSEQLILVEEM